MKLRLGRLRPSCIPFGSVGDRLMFASHLQRALEQQPNDIIFELTIKEIHECLGSDNADRAQHLIGQRGFPQLSVHLPTVESRWASMTLYDRCGLIMVVAAMSANEMLAKAIRQGDVEYSIHAYVLDHLSIRLSWSNEVAARFAELSSY